jgi:hypothetical protein
MRHLLSVFAAAAFLAPTVSAQTDYHFDIDPATSILAWDLDLNVGNIVEQPATFAFDGSLIMETGAAAAPFGDATLSEGLLLTAPLSIGGQIPNPVPFLPALGQFTVHKLQATISATNFVIAPSGAFTATAHMVTSAGTLTSTGTLGNAVTSLRGMFQSTQAISGTLTQSGTDLHLHIDLNVTLLAITPGGGLTGSLELIGPIDAYTSTLDADPMTLLSEQPVTVGLPTSLTVEHAAPNENVWLIYSSTGLGLTPVVPLGVFLGLDSNAALALGPLMSDGSGNVTFSVPSMPASFADRSLWLQAAQFGDVSNLVTSRPFAKTNGERSCALEYSLGVRLKL